MLKFRIINYHVPIAKLPYHKIIDNNPEQIECPLCKETHEDEFHYILVCQYFTHDCNSLFKQNMNGINVLTF